MGAASPAAASPRPAAAAPWAACQAAAAIRRRRPPRPQLSRSRHANFWLGTKGSARAGRGRALLPRAAPPARPPLAGSARLALLPFPRAAAPSRPARAAPLDAGERDAESQGRRTGAEPGRGAAQARERGRRRGLEDEEAKEGLLRGSGRRSQAPAARLTGPRPPRPLGRRENPASREGEGRGAAPARVSAAPRKSPDKGKPRPPPAGPAPATPAAPAASRPTGLLAQGRANPEGAPPPPPSQPVQARATRGPICPQGSDAACIASGSSSAAKGVSLVPPMSPLAPPCRAQEHSSLKPGT